MVIKMLYLCKDVAVEYAFCPNFDDTGIHGKAYEMVRELANKEFGPIITDIDKTEWGKPFFASDGTLKMSISHTDDFVAVAVCRGAEIGIDAERIHFYDDKIIKCFYSEQELTWRDSGENQDKKETIIWTRKEAYCKCVGEGITFENLKRDTTEDCAEYIQQSVTVDKYIISICKEKRKNE